MSIALENHDEHGTGELAAFLERAGSLFVGVCLNTVNSISALEPPDRLVHNLAPYTLNLPEKDFEVVRFGSERGFSIVGRPAGAGRLNGEWIAGRLKEGGGGRFREVVELYREMFAPVVNGHRITVEQMALLEPAMSEVVGNSCVTHIKEALDETIRYGVPAETATTFMLGHLQIELVILFKSGCLRKIGVMSSTRTPSKKFLNGCCTPMCDEPGERTGGRVFAR